MGAEGGSRRVVRFGAFEADLDAGELFRNGRKVRLSEQPFQLLALLLESPGEVVSREELRNRLWPGDTYVDFDRSLNTAASKLRDALGDTPGNPLYVQTLPRRGYRFMAPVTCSPPESAAMRAPLARRRIAWRQILGVTLVALGALLGLRRQPGAPAIERVRPLTNDGLGKFPTLATDGSRVYFSVWQNRRWTLAHAAAPGSDTVLIPTPSIGQGANACVRGISPDRSTLLIVTGPQRTSLTGFPVWAVDFSGLAGRRIGELVANDVDGSPDGKSLAYVTKNQVWVTDRDGRAARKVAESGVLAGDPHWSPDGRRIRFTSTAADNWERTIREVAAGGGQSHPLFPDFPGEQWGGRWTPDGRYYLFNSDSDLWAAAEPSGWFQKSRPAPVRLTFGPLAFFEPHPSSDGRIIYAVGELKRAELLRFDPKTREFHPVLPGLSATFVDYSRDGQWIVYVTYPQGELWRSRQDGSERLQLTAKPWIAAHPRWSPDGRRIAFAARTPRHPWKAYIVSSAGGNPVEAGTGDHTQPPSWSPGGDSLALGGPDGCLGVLDLRTGKLATLPGSAGLIVPAWSPDGRYISARRADNEATLVFDVASGSWSPVEGPPGGCNHHSWLPDSSGFLCMEGKGEAVHRWDHGNRRIEKVIDLDRFRPAGMGAGAWLGVAPDGSPLVAKDAGAQEIYALECRLP